MKLEEILRLIIQLIPTAKMLDPSRAFGFIHKQAPVEINGVKGLLIWDYILWNEITFQDMEQKNIISLFTGFNDVDTEDRWNELIEEYSIKK